MRWIGAACLLAGIPLVWYKYRMLHDVDLFKSIVPGEPADEYITHLAQEVNYIASERYDFFGVMFFFAFRKSINLA